MPTGWAIVLTTLLLTGLTPATSPGPDEVEMVLVPAGELVMGSDDAEADDDERPVARIMVATFWIDRVEVSNARYRRCVEAGPCAIPVGGGVGDPARAEHPVVVVSWRQAVTYCRWAGKRLPTEA